MPENITDTASKALLFAADWAAPRTCIHCRKHEREHSNGKCLFEATSFHPMTPDEYVAWRRKVWAVRLST